MFKENKLLENLLNLGRKIIPKRLFKAGQPVYHWFLAWIGALLYGFPSGSMKIIGVTGTKGKSTTVFLIDKILEETELKIAMIGSLGYKIGNKEWPNNLKMTMPGRFKVQQFLHQAKKADCKFVVLEVTSEGIKQKRHLGIKFDSAVLTNIHREHLENHGSFENYIRAKEQLFRKTKHIHILNEDEPLLERFRKFKSDKKILYGWRDWEKLNLSTELDGDFNKYNILAAVAVAQNYGVSLDVIKKALAKITSISGRMEHIEAGQPFKVVVDYAHTPDSLEMVYGTLRDELNYCALTFRDQVTKGTLPKAQVSKTSSTSASGRLICVLGAAGGGRDKWKRPEFGKIAAKYCDEIILTDEDSYDENPSDILSQIENGFSKNPNDKIQMTKYEKILDRKEAIKKALTLARQGDTVVITGKGSETSMALAGGRKIPWSDKQVVLDALRS